jgi:hypothetical protein
MENIETTYNKKTKHKRKKKKGIAAIIIQNDHTSPHSPSNMNDENQKSRQTQMVQPMWMIYTLQP